MNKQVLSGMGLGALLLFILIGAGVYVYSQTEISQDPITEVPAQTDNGSGNPAAGGIEPTLFDTKITFAGTITCLPHKGDGPHTMECAYGLKADNGSYYALKNLFNEPGPWEFDVNDRIEVAGMLRVPEPNEKYDIVGVIEVESKRGI